jgi:hypothetical protein
MANTRTEIKRLEFIIEDTKTHCNVFYTSDEPGNPFWGGGWKTMSFGSHWSITTFIEKHIAGYISWENGRYNPVKDEVEGL